MSKTAELTPEQSKENMDDLLELQIEEQERRKKLLEAHEAYKTAKASHEAKEAEIIHHLEGLNQELPLFDDSPENIPWPFPLPDGEINKATLANVAADPLVIGLSSGVVKAVKEKCQATTLGELQKHLAAGNGMKVEEITKAKKGLARLLGPAQALRLLRGVNSFVEPRKAIAEKEKKSSKKKESGE